MKAGWPWLGRCLPYVRQSRQDNVRHLALQNTGCTIPGGTTGVLGVMVMPYHSEHRWSRVGAVYVSDICHFRDMDDLTAGSAQLEPYKSRKAFDSTGLQAKRPTRAVETCLTC